MQRLSRLLLLVLLLLVSNEGFSQFKKRKKSKGPTYGASYTERFLQTQWWLGFMVGTNLTQADPVNRYSVFSPTNYAPGMLDKEYQSFNKPGVQAGVEIAFYHRGFTIALQPNYRRQRFTYSNELAWEDPADPALRLELMYEQDHKLDYIDFPLLVRYDFTRTQVRPYIQAGAYYGILVNATKQVEVSGTDFASGGEMPFEGESIIVGAKDLFISSSVGLVGGVGVSYDVWNIRMVFEANYRYGLNNITDTENRYTNNQLAGIGDAMDDIKLRNISFSFGVLFPLRFISSGLNSID